MHNAFVWIIAVASILCMLIRPRRIAEVWWISGGALLLLALQLVAPGVAGAAVRKGEDVYLFLAGMMVLAELARVEGVFEWIAHQAAHKAKGSAPRLFLLVYLAGTVVTIFLSNDATAVVLTPAVLAIVRQVRVRPAGYLIACAMIANAASFVLPISNPANLVIFGRQLPPLGIWLAHLAWPSVVAIGVTFVVLRLLYRKDLNLPMPAELPAIRLSAQGRLALFGLVGASATLVVFSALGRNLGWPTCGAAATALALVSWKDRSVSLRVGRSVAWSVIILVAALFVIVAALQGAGGLQAAETALKHADNLDGPWSTLSAGFGVGLLSNLMNNLPVGLFSSFALQGFSFKPDIAYAVTIGIDLGPNLSVTGSLATILWLLALRREGVVITAWEFLKIGAVVMPLSMIPCLLVLR
jgi:arsenical pump membrane protein